MPGMWVTVGRLRLFIRASQKYTTGRGWTMCVAASRVKTMMSLCMHAARLGMSSAGRYVDEWSSLHATVPFAHCTFAYFAAAACGCQSAHIT